MARIASGIFSLEIRPWVQAAADTAIGFSTASGTTGAYSVIWTEIIYAVNDVPLVYLHYPFQDEDIPITSAFHPVLQGQANEYCWYFPELSLTLRRRDGEKSTFDISLSLDIGVPCDDIVGTSGVTFWINGVEAETVRAFAHELETQLEDVYQGRHPHPSLVPPMYRSFSFSRQINAQAYDAITESEREAEEEPPVRREQVSSNLDKLVESEFALWTATLPQGAHILDVGCGDGLPMLAHFAAQGYQVTGIDISPIRLKHARVNVPGAILRNMSPCELDESNVFDGVYSVVSLLHLDPIELRVALWRIHAALKPGGHLLVISVIENRHQRYAPLDWFQGQRVWQWYYDPKDFYRALEEYGLYEIISHQEQLLFDPEEPEAEERVIPLFPWLYKKRSPIIYSLLARKI